MQTILEKAILDEKTRHKTAELIRLVRWMEANPAVKRSLCARDCEVTPNEFVELMHLLRANGFPEMIYVLLCKHLTNDTLEQATKRLLLEKTCQAWEKIGSDTLFENLQDNIYDEMIRKDRSQLPF